MATMRDGRLLTDDAEEILEALMADAKQYFGPDLNDDELAAIRLFYAPIAEQLAEAQGDIRMVLNSAQLDYAGGTALDLLTNLIGVTREEASAASGYVAFSRDTRTHRTYTAPSGTTVQTDSNDPTTFETTDTATLPLYHDFEDGSLPASMSGDTASATVQATTTLEGEYSLELDATSGAEVYDDSVTVERGMTVHYYTQASSGTVPIFTFLKEDEQNYYQVVIDQANGRVAIESVVDGATPAVVDEDTTATVPAGERLDVAVTPQKDGDIVATVYDASGAEVTEVFGNDTSHTSGYLGYKSGDATSTKYFDYSTTSRTTAPVEAVESGLVGNVGANSIVVMPDPPTGIDSVTNPKSTGGGSAEEDDVALRGRAKEELAEGSRASKKALYSAIRSLDGVTSVSVFDVDTDGDGVSDGFEVVVEGGNTQEIAQTLMETMAAGDTSHGGVNGSAASGSAELPNGQTFTIEFSRPSSVQIYVDADIDVTDEFSGKDAVRDSIVDYIGGLLTSGNEVTGLGTGEDVIYGEVEYAIREVEGVYDIPTLYVDTTSGGTNQTNISILDSEVATSDGTDGSITMTTTEVNP